MRQAGSLWHKRATLGRVFYGKERPLGRDFYGKERPLGRDFYGKERPLGRGKSVCKIICKSCINQKKPPGLLKVIILTLILACSRKAGQHSYHPHVSDQTSWTDISIK